MGFEPTVRGYRTPDFESGSFDHSDTSPLVNKQRLIISVYWSMSPWVAPWVAKVLNSASESRLTRHDNNRRLHTLLGFNQLQLPTDVGSGFAWFKVEILTSQECMKRAARLASRATSCVIPALITVTTFAENVRAGHAGIIHANKLREARALVCQLMTPALSSRLFLLLQV